jgi:serine/threonine protein kinase
LSEGFPAQLAGFRPGSLMAGYRLEAQVGAGGMAVVFRARDQRLGRLVALKILAPALAADGPFRQRFIAESQAAAAVDDPHILPVYEAGEADGVLFIAMRFVGGGDLRLVLEREGPLPPGRAVEFISPVAAALDAAHRAGLVHRDVKPANILVDARPDRPEHVYLSDFGVSKSAMTSVSLTGTGQFVGTPAYSAPEQIQGPVVDGRTDQYALACVAYQLLAGTPPFERHDVNALFFAHLYQPPPSLGSRRPGLPSAVDQVLARAMAKAPANRYGSCRDFADALRAALGPPPGHSQGPVESAIRGAHQVPFARNAAPPQNGVDLEAELRRLRERLAALEHAREVSAADDVILGDDSRDRSPGKADLKSGLKSGTIPTVEPRPVPGHVRPAPGRSSSGRGSPEGIAERGSVADVLDAYEDFRRENKDDEYDEHSGPPGDENAGPDRIGTRPTPAKRRIGRRRGRSNHHRLWLALAGVVVATAVAITGIIKFEFPVQSGPAHTIVTPARIGTYVHTVAMDEQTKVAELRDEVITISSGQASDLVWAVYESGDSAAGSTEQIVLFIGGHLANANPAASIASFTRKFPGATLVSAGSLGGQAACVEEGTGTSDAASTCVWFDNDSFGEIVSPTMNAASLASMMRTIRPAVELVVKK